MLSLRKIGKIVSEGWILNGTVEGNQAVKIKVVFENLWRKAGGKI